MIALSYFRTFGMPVIITRCSNNYGPYQFPEKLIPLLVTNALADKELPVYGDGLNVRDWVHVADHCRGIELALRKGVPGNVTTSARTANGPTSKSSGAFSRLSENPSPSLRT